MLARRTGADVVTVWRLSGDALLWLLKAFWLVIFGEVIFIYCWNGIIKVLITYKTINMNLIYRFSFIQPLNSLHSCVNQTDFLLIFFCVIKSVLFLYTWWVHRVLFYIFSEYAIRLGQGSLKCASLSIAICFYVCIFAFYGLQFTYIPRFIIEMKMT